MQFAWIMNGTSYPTSTVALPVSQGQVVIFQFSITYDNGCIILSDAEQFVPKFQTTIVSQRTN